METVNQDATVVVTAACEVVNEETPVLIPDSRIPQVGKVNIGDNWVPLAEALHTAFLPHWGDEDDDGISCADVDVNPSAAFPHLNSADMLITVVDLQSTIPLKPEDWDTWLLHLGITSGYEVVDTNFGWGVVRNTIDQRDGCSWNAPKWEYRNTKRSKKCHAVLRCKSIAIIDDLLEAERNRTEAIQCDLPPTIHVKRLRLQSPQWKLGRRFTAAVRSKWNSIRKAIH